MSNHRCGWVFGCLLLGLVIATPAEAQRKLGCTTGEVHTEHGPVCGIGLQSQGVSINAHLGIPFAAPPTGANRWMPPKSPDAWSKTHLATQFAPACPQWTKNDRGQSTQVGQEDCLYLNVWAPQNAQSLPVMVWIYGGAFVEGGAFYPLFDGAMLAATGNVVVVDFNYRLGALGFLAAGTPFNLNGNYGFLDQQAALTWVKNNIANFGGDPTKVTIFGESAGAMSTGLHLLSAPASKSLFRAGAMASNPLALSFQTLGDAQQSGNQFVSPFTASPYNCHDLSCLQGLKVETILNAQGSSASMAAGGSLTWGPVIDRTVITTAPLTSFGNLDKPMLLGTNHDEGTFFVDSDSRIPNPLSNPYYKYGVIPTLFTDPSVAKAVLNQYPPGSGTGHGDNIPLLSQLLTDLLFTCANRYAVGQIPNSQKAYAYQFNAVSGFDWPLTGCSDYVCHGAELPYVFDTASAINVCGNGGTSSCSFNTGQGQLSTAMMKYWSSFASGLQPSGSVAWPAFNKYLQLNATDSAAQITASGDDPFKATCCFWENLNVYGTPSAGCSSGSTQRSQEATR